MRYYKNFCQARTWQFPKSPFGRGNCHHPLAPDLTKAFSFRGFRGSRKWGAGTAKAPQYLLHLYKSEWNIIITTHNPNFLNIEVEISTSNYQYNLPLLEAVCFWGLCSTVEPGFCKWQNGKFPCFSKIFTADKSSLFEWFCGIVGNTLYLVNEILLNSLNPGLTVPHLKILINGFEIKGGYRRNVF